MQASFKDFIADILSEIFSADPGISNVDLIGLFSDKGNLQNFVQKFDSGRFTFLPKICEYHQQFFDSIYDAVFRLIKSQSPGDIRWRNTAYPLQLLDIKIQGARYSSKEAMIGMLRNVLSQLEKGHLSGSAEDDDFGYQYSFDSNIQYSIFEHPPTTAEIEKEITALYRVSEGGSTCNFCGALLFGGEQFTHICRDQD